MIHKYIESTPHLPVIVEQRTGKIVDEKLAPVLEVVAKHAILQITHGTEPKVIEEPIAKAIHADTGSRK